MYSIWDENYIPNEYQEHLLVRANVPEYRWVEEKLRVEECDVASYERLSNIRENLQELINEPKNNILIYGHNLGNGKTSWAYKFILTQVENNWKRIYAEEFEITDKQFDIALFIRTVPFILDIKQFGNNKQAEELYFRAKKTELLVLDDIAAVNMSQYDYNILYSIVEDRLAKHIPTIFTTNCTSVKEMNNIFGSRLAERIWDTSKLIELKGKGMRG